MEIYFFHFHTKNTVKKFISTSMRRELETLKYARKKKQKKQNKKDLRGSGCINTTCFSYYMKIRNISIKMKIAEHSLYVLLGNVNSYHADFQHGKTMLLVSLSCRRAIPIETKLWRVKVHVRSLLESALMALTVLSCANLPRAGLIRW